jgi:hypothetical protein
MKTIVSKQRRVGAPIGSSNNPNGRPRGSKNKISYDIRTAIYEYINDGTFINGLFDDIDAVKEAEKRAKLKIELVKLFVPRPLNNDEQKDKDIKSAIWEKLSGQAKDKDDFSNTSRNLNY